jgi:hypothetical protein
MPSIMAMMSEILREARQFRHGRYDLPHFAAAARRALLVASIFCASLRRRGGLLHRRGELGNGRQRGFQQLAFFLRSLRSWLPWAISPLALLIVRRLAHPGGQFQQVLAHGFQCSQQAADLVLAARVDGLREVGCAMRRVASTASRTAARVSRTSHQARALPKARPAARRR